MAGFVVRGGSEEAPRGSFLPRFLGFLLLFLVLAHRASAGVFGRGTNGNAQEPESHSLCGFNITRNYLGQFYNKCYKFKSKITYADVSGRGRTNDMTQDQGIVLTSDNKNKFKHHNDPAYNKHDNNKYGSTFMGVVDRGQVDDPDENQIHTYNDLKSLYDDKNRNTLNSYPKPRPSYIGKISVVLLCLLFPLAVVFRLARLHLCFQAYMRTGTGMEERRQVVLMVLRTRGAEDAPEADDRQADAPPTYTDILKAESPPSYSEVCPEATSLWGN
ncbi:uncharacterized protein LOC122263126 [Penaeus japonicus]|uniref:uncharacterized protein LOC122263126 n=1 Tax=Penaeus japonicus TaxID=27405 RepID=UPI001C70E83C|nr:uncharacterized protein LOC122263126 [Penaeus japonicus]XP_042887390.1 uncharacterized protein LOC122263126 [Penaeus japonicus]